LLIAQNAAIDLLFTDIVTPEMNGRELSERALALRPALMALIATGYTRNAEVHNRVLDPGTAFLQKLFTVDQLALKIRAVLDS
jgi:DNA-binding NtrC family response regulator